MYTLTAIVTYDENSDTRQEVCLGIFDTKEAAIAAGRKDILRYAEDDETSIEIKNTKRYDNLNIGAVFVYVPNATKFAVTRHYWVEKVVCCSPIINAAKDLLEDKTIENDFPELYNQLYTFLVRKLSK